MSKGSSNVATLFQAQAVEAVYEWPEPAAPKESEESNMETLKNERGSVLLYVAGSLIVMALFVGLAIDGGWTTYVRNQGQDAVEAAALSAASAIPTYQVSATSSIIELRAAAFAQKAASSASANRIMQQVPMLTLANNIDCLHYDQT